MATVNVTPGYNWVSGEVVTPAKMNSAAAPTVAVSNIVAADIAAGAVTNAKLGTDLDASKLTAGTLPAARIGADAINASRLAANAVETAKINNAAVTAPKLSGAQTGSAPIYGVRAWVNFDGTKDTADAVSTANTNRKIRGNGNVASVLRNGLGDYTITFTTAMPDENYAVVITTCGATTANQARNGVVKGDAATGATNKTTTQVTIMCGNTSSTAEDDLAEVNVMVLR